MLLNVLVLLTFMLQAPSPQQKEGIGNLLAIGLLALFVVVFLVIGIRYKNKIQQSEVQETIVKNTPLEEGTKEPSKKALM